MTPINTQVKAIVTDVYNTVLVTDARPREPYLTLLEALAVKDPRATLHADRAILLAQKTTLEAYAAKYAPDDLSEERFQQIITNAEDLLQKHHDAYRVRAEWPEFLILLHHYNLKLSFCSNLAQPFTQNVHEKFPEVATKIYSCECGLVKPQPEIFQLCADEMGVKPEEIIMIGDSFASDITGAKQAGFANAYWMNKGQGLNSLTDVFPMMRREKLLSL